MQPVDFPRGKLMDTAIMTIGATISITTEGAPVSTGTLFVFSGPRG